MNRLSIFYSSPLLSLEWTLYKKDFLENSLKKIPATELQGLFD